MLQSKLVGMFVGCAMILALAGGLAVQSSFAQQPPQEGVAVQPGPAPRPGAPGVAPGAGMGMGGGVTMAADGTHLYIVIGQRLLKVNKATLELEREAMLRPNRPAPRE